MATDRNPLTPDSADYSNQTNRSGTMREGVTDAASRMGDSLTGRDEDLDAHRAGMGTMGTTGTMGGGANSGARYYHPMEGREHLSGLFRTRMEAETAVSQLEHLGVPRSDISVILRNEQESAEFADRTGVEHHHSKAGEGAGKGSMYGGLAGAAIGALVATATSIAIPGAGIVLAGPLAGALAGAGAGGAAGGLLGAMVGAGIPEETARTYESGLQSGGVVVVADVPASLASQARTILGTSY
jgi:hypothetical protein